MIHVTRALAFGAIETGQRKMLRSVFGFGFHGSPIEQKKPGTSARPVAAMTLGMLLLNCGLQDTADGRGADARLFGNLTGGHRRYGAWHFARLYVIGYCASARIHSCRLLSGQRNSLAEMRHTRGPHPDLSRRQSVDGERPVILDTSRSVR